MSTPSIAKKVIVSAIVALPFPFLLLLALDAGSALPGAQSAMDFLGSDGGPAFYLISWVSIVLSSFIAMLLVNPSSSVAEELDEGDASSSVPEGKDRGTVKWFNVNKGFGFITTDDGEDVFVHFRSIRGRGRRSLRQGQTVRFDISEGDKGLQAENVSVLK